MTSLATGVVDHQNALCRLDRASVSAIKFDEPLCGKKIGWFSKAVKFLVEQQHVVKMFCGEV